MVWRGLISRFLQAPAMSRPLFIFALALGLSGFSRGAALAGEIKSPQVTKPRYEAADPKAGGQFVLWSERERIFYGLDPKLFPAAQYVEGVQVTHTPALM